MLLFALNVWLHMNSFLRFGLVFILLTSLVYLFLTLRVECSSSSLCVSAQAGTSSRIKTLAFEAIADLHSQLDEDSSGGVDFTEASLVSYLPAVAICIHFN